MFTTAPMELLSLVVFKEKSEEVVSHLLKLGIFHPVDIRHIEEGLAQLNAFDIKREYAEWDALEGELKIIAHNMNISLYARQSGRKFAQEEIKKRLAEIKDRITPLLTRREDLREEIKTKSSMVSQINEYLLFPVKNSSSYSFLEVSLGKLQEKNVPLLEGGLENIPHITYPLKKDGGYIVTVFIGLRRDRVVIEAALREAGWQKIELSDNPQNLSRDVEKKILAEIDGLKKGVMTVDDELRKLAEELKDESLQMYSYVVLNKYFLEAKKYFCSTERTSLLSGWVPREEKDRVLREISDIAGVSVVETKTPEEVPVDREDIPVRLLHTPFFKPFELLITSYGLPRYGSIDPTFFTAVSFLIMFGAMFGDLGHGLVLMAAGLFLGRARNEKIKQAAALVMYSGISSGLFGFLEGSFFGWEFKSFWAKPMENILGVFKISVLFGVSVITLGIIFNVVNSLKDKDYVKALLDKAGLIGGLVYWAAIGLVSKSFVARGEVNPVYLYLIFGGILVLFLKPFFELFLRKRKENIFETFIEGLVDILEIFMGYLANTVSFIRIAAFSLAHAGLFLAIFELAKVVKDVGNGAVSVLVIVAGNIIVILLEGMVVGIQSLRLNYYEFFSRFFLTGRNEYKPMSL
ncbi:MAG: V-type ATPase 116kDa subunit family protein [Candidatus Omnitrophica bacterium]|nr:V-type ATPase 116kDa subunit family protein [Candidatus Omnitrophota bacterium]